VGSEFLPPIFASLAAALTRQFTPGADELEKFQKILFSGLQISL
jgi:hypothetical protein